MFKIARTILLVFASIAAGMARVPEENGDMDDPGSTTPLVASERPAMPSRLLLLAEAHSAITLFPRRTPPDVLEQTPTGGGQPVLALPAFLQGDWETSELRAFLMRKGYAAYGWDLGVNWGPTDRVLSGMERRLVEVAARHDAKVTLIGHSLGGTLARELAKKRPDLVREVIVLAAPIRAPAASPVEWLYDALAWTRGPAAAALEERLNDPPAVPVTAIYSRSDGLVAWQSCLEAEGPERRNIAIAGTHVGMTQNPAALRIIAERLSDPGHG